MSEEIRYQAETLALHAGQPDLATNVWMAKI